MRKLPWLVSGICVAGLAACKVFHPAPETGFRADPAPARVSQGKHLVLLMCAPCHYDPATKRLSGAPMGDIARYVGRIYSGNLTHYSGNAINHYTDGDLAVLLRTGVAKDGGLMPYMQKPLLADEDLKAIIAFLRSEDPLLAPSSAQSPGTRYTMLGEIGLRVVMRPLAYPQAEIPRPAPGDALALGKYLTSNLDCYACHSASLLRIDHAEPTRSKGYLGGGTRFVEAAKLSVYSPNLTFDETGLAGWTEEDLVRAVRTGIAKDHRILASVMPTFAELTNAEITAIYQYLRSLPHLRHRVPQRGPEPVSERPLDISGAGAPLVTGRQSYEKYGCIVCHGPAGVGVADFRHISAKYTEEQMLAYIRNPLAYGNQRMPAFGSIIAEPDYPSLITYVRAFATPVPKP